MGALCKGAHQLGLRWNTVRWPAVSAITGISCTAVAPVPMTPTRLPESSSGSRGPVRSVEGGPAEIRHAFDLGHLRDGERADRRDEPAGARAMPVLRLDLPGEPVLVPGRADDPRPEPDIAAQVELVGDEVHIAQGFGLGREMLAPIPLLKQFPGEGEAVAVALGIEARAGIAVPVPGAADIAAGLEHPHPEAEFPEPVKLVEAGNARADHDGVMLFAVRRPAHAA